MRENHLIAASIIGPTEGQALRDMELALMQGADYLEIRWDAFREGKPNLERIFSHNDVPKIFTCRHGSEAGPDKERFGFNGTEEQRQLLYLNAVNLGFDFIDVEYHNRYLIQGKDLGNTKLIFSAHNFDKTSSVERIKELFYTIAGACPDIAKVAMMAHCKQNSLNMLTATKEVSEKGVKAIGICMGSEGVKTMYDSRDSIFTYAAICRGNEAAPGQPTIRQLREYWEIHPLIK